MRSWSEIQVFAGSLVWNLMSSSITFHFVGANENCMMACKDRKIMVIGRKRKRKHRSNRVPAPKVSERGKSLRMHLSKRNAWQKWDQQLSWHPMLSWRCMDSNCLLEQYQPLPMVEIGVPTVISLIKNLTRHSVTRIKFTSVSFGGIEWQTGAHEVF